MLYFLPIIAYKLVAMLVFTELQSEDTIQVVLF